jgi:hypothetical protein
MWQTGAMLAVCDGCFRFDSYHLSVIIGGGGYCNEYKVCFYCQQSAVQHHNIKTVNRAVGNVVTFTYR